MSDTKASSKHAKITGRVACKIESSQHPPAGRYKSQATAYLHPALWSFRITSCTVILTHACWDGPGTRFHTNRHPHWESRSAPFHLCHCSQVSACTDRTTFKTRVAPKPDVKTRVNLGPESEPREKFQKQFSFEP